MKKRVLSLLMAAMSVAMFGILYPEYILLPDTYEYISEKSSQEEAFYGEEQMADISKLLYAEPEQIRVSSKLLRYLAEEGRVLWKSKD